MFGKRFFVVLFFLLIAIGASCQSIHEIDSAGLALDAFYKTLHVDKLWLPGNHVNWETGESDKPKATSGVKSHCSAFVAAACERRHIYILRPPEHGQILLANAQSDWLGSEKGYKEGWRVLNSDDACREYEQAQAMANDGYIVVAVMRNEDDHKAGHIALVRPHATNIEELQQNGPEVIQAGLHNYTSTSLRKSFEFHIKEWPDENIWFYYNINR